LGSVDVAVVVALEVVVAELVFEVVTMFDCVAEVTVSSVVTV